MVSESVQPDASPCKPSGAAGRLAEIPAGCLRGLSEAENQIISVTLHG